MYIFIIISVILLSSITMNAWAEGDSDAVTYAQIHILAVTETSFNTSQSQHDVVQGKYLYRPQIEGWIAQHKVIATWEEAYRKCRAEGYAVLASPISGELLYEMRTMIGDGNDSTSHYIGTSTDFYPGRQFVSIEGVALDEMPVTNMVKQLDTQIGSCLSINNDSIEVVSCTARLPYWCYKKQEANMIDNGPCDEGYLQYLSTGSCYKMHYEKVTWDQAYTTCAAEGGYLTIINDEREAHIVHNITGHLPEPFVFIGLRDREGRGDWMSVHGQRVEQIYNVWGEGAKLASIDYRCGRILNTGKLDYCTCTYERPFLCEKEPYSNSLYRTGE